jgi:hypothetical protein
MPVVLLITNHNSAIEIEDATFNKNSFASGSMLLIITNDFASVKVKEIYIF